VVALKEGKGESCVWDGSRDPFSWNLDLLQYCAAGVCW